MLEANFLLGIFWPFQLFLERVKVHNLQRGKIFPQREPICEVNNSLLFLKVLKVVQQISSRPLHLLIHVQRVLMLSTSEDL